MDKRTKTLDVGLIKITRELKHYISEQVKSMKSEISNLESDKNNLRREVTRMKSEISQEISRNYQLYVYQRENDISTLDTTLDTLERKVSSQESRIIKLESDKTSKERRLTKIENKPYAFQCAGQPSWTTGEGSIVTWEGFFSNWMSGVTGGLSLSSGVFTAGHSGIWEVTYSLLPLKKEGGGDWIVAYLFVNGLGLSAKSLGSRTLFVKLSRGDKVDLRTEDPAVQLYDNTLCFRLVQPL